MNIKRAGWYVMAVAAVLVILFHGCSTEGSKYPSPEGEEYPYILKEDCTFTIVEELSRASISSPKVSGLPGSSASGSVSLGDHSITVSDCMVIENPGYLPIYEK